MHGFLNTSTRILQRRSCYRHRNARIIQKYESHALYTTSQLYFTLAHTRWRAEATRLTSEMNAFVTFVCMCFRGSGGGAKRGRGSGSKATRKGVCLIVKRRGIRCM